MKSVLGVKADIFSTAEVPGIQKRQNLSKVINQFAAWTIKQSD